MSPTTQLILMPELRAALQYADNESVFAACERHKIPVVTLSRQQKGLRLSDLDLLLQRASGEVA